MSAWRTQGIQIKTSRQKGNVALIAKTATAIAVKKNRGYPVLKDKGANKSKQLGVSV